MATTRRRGVTRSKSRSPKSSGALTGAQLRQLEAELLAERERLARSLGGTTYDATTHLGASVERASSGDADGELRIAFRGRARARHEAIGAALRRLADGTYGRCTGCGAHIPFGRLLVMPEAERCVAC